MYNLKLGQSIRDIISKINSNFTELNNRKSYKVLYSGSTEIPCKSDGTNTIITLSDNLSNYDGVIIQLEGCDAWQSFETLSVGKVLKPVHNQFDMTEAMSGWNMFGYNCEIMSNKRIKLSGFIFSGSNYDKDPNLDIYLLRYMEQYSVYPLTKVIGIKLT